VHPKSRRRRSAYAASNSVALARNLGTVTEPIDRLPGIDDEPAGVYFPHAVGGTDEEIDRELGRLFDECRVNGEHHLATRDDPNEGLVIACTHCHRFWRPAV
jgi:hypothetical protein